MKEFVFRGLRPQTTDEKRVLSQKLNPVENNVVHDSSLLDVIFAPDPVSGNPSSDLFMDLQADPNLKDFVRRELQSVRLEMSKTDDVNLALDFTKTRNETKERYLERLQGYFSDKKE